MTIKDLRLKSGKSAMEISRELGIHLNTYYAIETGKCNIKPYMITALADVFGCGKNQITPNDFWKKSNYAE